MTETVKIAVIGIGIMGKAHLKDIAALENTELVAICDLDRATADQAAAETNTNAYYDYRDLLDHEPLDAVLVATPHYDHTPISIAALRKGIHVLVEKPIAVHVKDGRRMIAAYQEAKQDVSCSGLRRRFHAAHLWTTGAKSRRSSTTANWGGWRASPG